MSLRALMLAIVVMALAFGKLAHEAHKQRLAFAAVQAHGGSISFRPLLPSGWLGRERQAWIGTWLERQLNDPFFWRVNMVSLRGGWLFERAGFQQAWRPADDVLERVARLSSLTAIELERTQVTERGLKLVAEMSQLQSLVFEDAPSVNDATIHSVAGLAHLELLGIAGCKVSDEELVHLAGLKNLKSLILANTEVTDAGLQHLKALKNLKCLWVSNTAITDDGMNRLRKLLPGLARAYRTDNERTSSVSLMFDELGQASAASIREKISTQYPAVVWSGQGTQTSRGSYSGECYSITFTVEGLDQPYSVVAQIIGGRGAVIDLQRLTRAYGWRIIEPPDEARSTP